MQAFANAATFLRLAALAAVLALVGLLGVRPSIDSQAGARAMGPLPACRYDDILTSPRGYGDWSETLVDTILRVPKSYAPPDLVSVSTAGIAGSGKVRAVVIDDLREMSEAATLAGNPIGVRSAYRSYATQQTVFSQYVARDGYQVALTYSARPGHSEHQLGLGIDFRSDPPVATLSQSWGATPAGAWMRRHAWEYGFVMSYPKGKMSLTCYSYEPWHFRYVGKDLAAKIHASELTPRQYLWAQLHDHRRAEGDPEAHGQTDPRRGGDAQAVAHDRAEPVDRADRSPGDPARRRRRLRRRCRPPPRRRSNRRRPAQRTRRWSPMRSIRRRWPRWRSAAPHWRSGPSSWEASSSFAVVGGPD